MAYSSSELDAIIVVLEAALATGTRRVIFPDRSEVEYDSVADLMQAIGYFKSLAADVAAGSTSRTSRLVLSPSSGIDV